jgi:hypothetical protein
MLGTISLALQDGNRKDYLVESEAFKVAVKLKGLSLSGFMTLILARCYFESSNRSTSDK